MKAILTIAIWLLGCSSFRAADLPKAPIQPSAEAVAKATALVVELGDSRFRVRENATQELRKLGRAAKQPLLEGLKSSDAEVWNRCAQLLPEVLDQDLHARVDAYMADPNGKFKHDIPMIGRYRKICGADAASRTLFVEILKNNANFLESCENEPKLAGEKYVLRAHDMQQQLSGPWSGSARPPLRPGDVGALFLVGADPEMSKSIPDNNFNPVSNFLFQEPVQSALRSGELAGVYRKLFFAWAENRGDVNSLSQALAVVQSLKMKEGLEFAVKVMKMKDLQVWTRAQALTTVGQIGGKEHVADMVALFADKTPVVNIQLNNVAINTQINDIALAMAIHLTGQSPKGYGFDALETNPQLIWAYHYLGFSTEEKRSAAFKKWKEWSEKQLKEEAKKEEPGKKK